ncbi:peptidase S51 [Pasteurella multocida subsp. multocida OH4807]|nr:peptidase S51 [Pasteurella multocida subsp. multocida OH4807]
MKTAFLTAYFANVIDLFLEQMGSIKGKKIAFIPTASRVEPIRFYVDEAKQALVDNGAELDELDLTTATQTEIEGKLTKSDIIYVSGGNTFFLLQELNRTGAREHIIQHVNAGKGYIGESAGAMIMAADIEYVKLMDSVASAPHLTDYRALNLVDFYPVPHYTNFPFIEATQHILEIYGSRLNLLPINNDQAIMVHNGQIEIKTKH